jgi:putative FmdB family regulatory protein
VPTYQYACTACDHRFEAVQSFSDASLTECPACSGLLRKVFSSVGIVFKGSGFYRTDSRSGAGSTVSTGSESNGSGSAEKSSSDKGSATKTESTTSASSPAAAPAPAAAAKS